MTDRYDSLADEISSPSSPSPIPERHRGVEYKSFSSQLSWKRGSKAYMEIGVQSGLHLSSIFTERALGVDPHFAISVNIAANKKKIELFQGTSDEFFASGTPHWMNDVKLDLIFLDGLHVFEFLLRDFINAEKLASRNGLIMMHDCLPLNAEMAERNERLAMDRGQTSKFPGAWTGDVWKIIPILRKYRPDLKVLCLDCPPTGMVCVTELDSTSTILDNRYLEIVDEFGKIPNTLSQIEEIYRNTQIRSSEKILNEFDHTLYFRL